MKCAVGLDIASLKSGAAVIDNGQTFLYSLVLDKKADLEERIFKHGIWARSIVEAHPKIECVFCESPVYVDRSRRDGKFLNVHNVVVISQVLGAVKACFWPCIVHQLQPSEWRLYTIGNIPAPKGMTEREALKLAAMKYTQAAGLNPRNDDEADAYAILRAGLALVAKDKTLACC